MLHMLFPHSKMPCENVIVIQKESLSGQQLKLTPEAGMHSTMDKQRDWKYAQT